MINAQKRALQLKPSRQRSANCRVSQGANTSLLMKYSSRKSARASSRMSKRSSLIHNRRSKSPTPQLEDRYLQRNISLEVSAKNSEEPLSDLEVA